MGTEEPYVPQDFVFCGQCILSDGKVGAELRPMTGPNLADLKPARAFELKPYMKGWIVGAIYSGAEFRAGGAGALDRAQFQRRGKYSDIAIWEAKHQETQVAVRLKRLESTAKRKTELDALMLPLREQYANLVFWVDQEALERAVIRSLRKKP